MSTPIQNSITQPTAGDQDVRGYVLAFNRQRKAWFLMTWRTVAIDGKTTEAATGTNRWLWWMVMPDAPPAVVLPEPAVKAPGAAVAPVGTAEPASVPAA